VTVPERAAILAEHKGMRCQAHAEPRYRPEGNVMQLHNLNIGARLALAFTAILLLTLGVVGTGVWLLDRNAALLDRIAFSDAEKERALRTWLMETRSNAVRGVVLTRSDDAQLKQLLTPEFEATSRRITEV